MASCGRTYLLLLCLGLTLHLHAFCYLYSRTLYRQNTLDGCNVAPLCCRTKHFCMHFNGPIAIVNFICAVTCHEWKAIGVGPLVLSKMSTVSVHSYSLCTTKLYLHPQTIYPIVDSAWEMLKDWHPAAFRRLTIFSQYYSVATLHAEFSPMRNTAFSHYLCIQLLHPCETVRFCEDAKVTTSCNMCFGREKNECIAVTASTQFESDCSAEIF